MGKNYNQANHGTFLCEAVEAIDNIGRTCRKSFFRAKVHFYVGKLLNPECTHNDVLIT